MFATSDVVSCATERSRAVGLLYGCECCGFNKNIRDSRFVCLAAIFLIGCWKASAHLNRRIPLSWCSFVSDITRLEPTPTHRNMTTYACGTLP